MPSEAIAKAQEVHAQACEKLGLTRCRITGMRYRLLGENNVEAMLAFKLDPALARGFGKDGIASAVAAEGKLVDAEITGTDAGAAIKRLDVQRARNDDELRRLDGLLANPRLLRSEREELQRQRAALVQSNTAAADDTADQQESLATTPMVFDYGSGPAVRGFDPSAPLKSAADTAVASVQITLAVLLGALALLGPSGSGRDCGSVAVASFRAAPHREAGGCRCAFVGGSSLPRHSCLRAARTRSRCAPQTSSTRSTSPSPPPPRKAADRLQLRNILRARRG